MERLSEQVIRKIPVPEKHATTRSDGEIPGFAVRVTPKGTRAFVLTYVIDGRQRRTTIGLWPTWTAAAARERAKALKRDIDKGIDPLAEKLERREAATFGELAQEYLDRHAAGKKSGENDAAQLRRYVLAKWGGAKAVDIKRRDIIRLIEETAARGASGHPAEIAANRLLALLRKMFNWAISRDLLEANPCSQVKAPGVERPRQRVLNEEEIRSLWTALELGSFTVDGKKEYLRMSPEVRAILKLILATAQRPGECCGLEWAEIDAEPGWWTVPSEKSKNGRAHRVPLSTLAREILKAQPRKGPYVFPSPRGGKPIAVNALSHALHNNNNEHLGLEHFTPHDLRRTATSHMPADRFIKERILNHADRAITGTYDRYEYSDEKKRALDAWARKLQAIISGKRAEKVVAIHLKRTRHASCTFDN